MEDVVEIWVHLGDQKLASTIDSLLDLVSGSVLWLTQRVMQKDDPCTCVV